MAILSRPSLRGPVRRNPDSRSESHGRPPMKKQRTLEDYGVRRRRSSPDCLDTTATQDMNAVDKARSIPPLKPAHPRSATKRARRHSSSSVDSIASATQLKTPNHTHINGNGSARNVRVPDRNTPSALQRLLDDRDSPDPLDTISPAPTTPISRPRSLASTNASETENKPSNSTATTNPNQKDDSDPTTELSDVVKEEESGEGPKAEQPTLTSPAAATRSQQKRKSELVELEQLAPAPAPAPTGTERRSLRSADTGSRCKSELAQYFYNYEQIISLQNPKPDAVETLAANTSITIVDDLSETLPFPKPDPNPFGNPLEKLYDCEPISLPRVNRHSSENDPLSEELYFKSHRRFERQEKQLRNIERDRAQHEKQQLDRLLEELRGQDWLRVMGLTGVHENEKKLYEPKRDILIQELVALLNKFQAWKDEEKRRKIAKEKTAPVGDAEADSRRSRKRSRPAEDATEESSLSPELATPSTPDPSDVDALAARQLHQEARSASDSAAKSRRKSISGPRKSKPKADEDEQTKTTDKKGSQKRQKTQEPEPSPIPPDPVPFLLPPIDDKPFTSFFSDPSERETALSAINGNREERTDPILAFGQPLGEVEEREFQPPDEFITEEAIQSSRRQRRLLKRRSHG
ncbi:hypothetical protein N7493_006737 [Penicillium malachiteum]|uniref:Something about silencing protein 4 domain-containing protein n=1 Tax=Penicillium malachiteum TaxID=1324776 RepID=A0AAD6MV09_9EURO|nr:hypothetical protein N7493_006737 [Penicillium malachiteum]